MPLVKIKQSYQNTNGWNLGDIVDCTNPWTLIKEGKVVLVNKDGNEIAPPAEVRSCPICLIFKTSDPYTLADHIIKTHPRQKEVVSVTETVKEVAATPEPVTEKVHEVTGLKKNLKDMTSEELKAWRIENLRKGREAAKAKKEAKLTAEAVKKVVANG